MTEKDKGVLRREAVRALASGKFVGGIRHGSSDGHRAMITLPHTSRKRCPCCGHRATHTGLGDGVALMYGCEWRVRLWVKKGYAT